MKKIKNISDSLHLKEPHSMFVRQQLIAIRKNLIPLSSNIIEQFKNNNLNDSDLQQWLQLQNALNMYKVCLSFKRGNMFYITDEYYSGQFFRQTKLRDVSTTTSSALQPIKYYSRQKINGTYQKVIYSVEHSYCVAETASSSKVLMDLLFTRTSLDCSAAVQIANYMTILDLLRLLHGPVQGSRIFDSIFDTKKNDSHNLNQLRIGIMGTVWSGNWYDFSPLYFFTKISDKEIVDLSRLKSNPEDFIGMQFGFMGHQSYLIKHPDGAAQSWNVVFLGNDESGPLFLAASELGQRFVFNVEEMCSILVSGFDKFPVFANRAFSKVMYTQSVPVGFMNNYRVFFDTNKIKLLITNQNECLSQLTDFCNHIHDKLVIKNGYLTTDGQVTKAQCFGNELSIKITDDHDPFVLKYIKSSFRPDPAILTTKDDLELLRSPKC